MGFTEARDVAHGMAAKLLQPGGESSSHAPEIRQRLMAPEQLPVLHFIQLRDPYAVLVRLDMLGDDIHGDFGQIHVRADAGGGGDPGGVEDFLNHGHRQLMSRHAIGLQISGDVQKAFIDGIHMDVFGADVLHVDTENPRAVFLIQLHLRRGGEIRHLEVRVGGERRGIDGRGCEGVLPVFILLNMPGADAIAQALCVDLLYPLDNLEKPCPAGNPVGLETGGHGQTDRFLRTAVIRHNQVGGQRVKVTLHAFDGSVETFQINGDIGSVHPASSFLSG